MKKNNRRSFIKKATGAGLSLGFLAMAPIEETLAYSTQKVNRNSAPADLKITDMRFAVVDKAPMRCPIIRIDTNQGIYGLGEVRDGATWRYALFLKSRLLGQNPCNVERLFKGLKQFGFHGRQGGGVSGVEMALWDLAGKAYGVPVYQLLGGKYRDNVRIYADTASSKDPVVYAKRMKERMDKGFTYLKMDFGVQLLKGQKDMVVNSKTWDIGKQWNREAYSYGMTDHSFTGIQITDKGLDKMCEYVAAVREVIGYDIPLAADHFGHFDVNTCIRLGKALSPYRLAFLEDLVPWKYTGKWRDITMAIDTPTLTGEDIYLKEDFIKLIDARAVTKKIGDYAEEKGVAMAMHFAGTPISFMANVHCAAATQNFVALEHHSVDIDWWEDLVKGIEKPICNKGFVKVPDTPGLGIELNDDVIKEHLAADSKFFEPTDDWNVIRSWDRLWS